MRSCAVCHARWNYPRAWWSTPGRVERQAPDDFGLRMLVHCACLGSSRAGRCVRQVEHSAARHCRVTMHEGLSGAGVVRLSRGTFDPARFLRWSSCAHKPAAT